ncbi:MAG: methyltransferase domain-containing protein [Verrucomicrobiales bacterium]|nr:methyltransferase domain-containing protein [Verrucomicrobiales bacterium]
MANLNASGNQDDQSRKLHLGCFDQVHDGWLNADITPHLFVARVPGLAFLLGRLGFLSGQRYEQHRQGIFRQVHYLNVAHRFPFPEKSFDFVYSAHMLEHLSPHDAASCIREVHRVLRNGGILRIAVPDLDELVQKYNPEGPEEFLTEFFEANQKSKKNRHHWHYNEASLRKLLSSAGFASVVRHSYREGHCADLERIENRPESLFVEATR